MKNMPIKMFRNEGLRRKKGKKSPFFVNCERFECDVCGASLKSKWNLKVHKESHGDPFECEICHMFFRYRHKLRAHMARHTGKIRYNCSECQASFGYQRDLISHFNEWHVQVEHHCHGCGAHFDKASAFDNHVTICINLQVPNVNRPLIGQKRHTRKESSSMLQRVPIHKEKNRNKRNKQRQKSHSIKESSLDSNESELHGTNSDIFYGRDYLTPEKFHSAQNSSKKYSSQKLILNTPNHMVTSSEKCSNIFQQCSSVTKKKYCKLKKNIMERIESSYPDCNYYPQKQSGGNKSEERPSFLEDHLTFRPTFLHQKRKGKRKYSLGSKGNPTIGEKDTDNVSNIEKLLTRKSVIGRSNRSVTKYDTFTYTRAKYRKTSDQDELAEIHTRLNNIEVKPHHTDFLTDIQPSAGEEMKTPTSAKSVSDEDNFYVHSSEQKVLTKEGKSCSKKAIDVDAKDCKNIGVSRKKYSTKHNSLDKDETCSKNVNSLHIENCKESNTRDHFCRERNIDQNDSANIDTSLTSSNVEVMPHHVYFFIDTEPCVAKEVTPTSATKALNFSESVSVEEISSTHISEQNVLARKGKPCSRNVIDVDDKNCKNVTVLRKKYSDECDTFDKKDDTTISGKKGSANIAGDRETRSKNLTDLYGAKGDERQNMSRNKDSAKHDSSPRKYNMYHENIVEDEGNSCENQSVPSKGDSIGNDSPSKKGKTCSKTIIILDEESFNGNQSVSRKRYSSGDISPKESKTCPGYIFDLDEESRNENKILPKKRNSNDINTPSKNGETCTKTIVIDSNESHSASRQIGTAKCDTSAWRGETCPKNIVKDEENTENRTVPSKENSTDNDSQSKKAKTCSKTVIVLDEENCDENQTVSKKSSASEHDILVMTENLSFDNIVMHEKSRTENRTVSRKRRSTDNDSSSKRGKTKPIIVLDDKTPGENQTVPRKRRTIDNDSQSKKGETCPEAIIFLDEENCDENQILSKRRHSFKHDTFARKGKPCSENVAIDEDRNKNKTVPRRLSTGSDSLSKRKETCSKTIIFLDEGSCTEAETVSRKKDSSEHDVSLRKGKTCSENIFVLDEENRNENQTLPKKKGSTDTLSKKKETCIKRNVLDSNENRTVSKQRETTKCDISAQEVETSSEDAIVLGEENTNKSQTVSANSDSVEHDTLCKKVDIIVLDVEDGDDNETLRRTHSSDFNTFSGKGENSSNKIIHPDGENSNERQNVLRKKKSAHCDNKAGNFDISEDIIVLHEECSKNPAMSRERDTLEHDNLVKNSKNYSENVIILDEEKCDEVVPRISDSSELGTSNRKDETCFKDSLVVDDDNCRENQFSTLTQYSAEEDTIDIAELCSKNVTVNDSSCSVNQMAPITLCPSGRKHKTKNVIAPNTDTCFENQIMSTDGETVDYGTLSKKSETYPKDLIFLSEDNSNKNQILLKKRKPTDNDTLARKSQNCAKNAVDYNGEDCHNNQPVPRKKYLTEPSRRDHTCSKNLRGQEGNIDDESNFVSENDDQYCEFLKLVKKKKSKRKKRKKEEKRKRKKFSSPLPTVLTFKKSKKEFDEKALKIAQRWKTIFNIAINEFRWKGCNSGQTVYSNTTLSVKEEIVCRDETDNPTPNILGEQDLIDQRNVGQQNEAEENERGICPNVYLTGHNIEENALSEENHSTGISETFIEQVNHRDGKGKRRGVRIGGQANKNQSEQASVHLEECISRRNSEPSLEDVNRNRKKGESERIKCPVQKDHPKDVSIRISEPCLYQVNHFNGKRKRRESRKSPAPNELNEEANTVHENSVYTGILYPFPENHENDKSKTRESTRFRNPVHNNSREEPNGLPKDCESTKISGPFMDHGNGKREGIKSARNRHPSYKDHFRENHQNDKSKTRESTRFRNPVHNNPREEPNGLPKDCESTKISGPFMDHGNGKREGIKSARNGHPPYKDHSEQDVEAAFQDMIQWIKRERSESDFDSPVPGDIQEEEDIQEKYGLLSNASSSQDTCVPWLSLECDHSQEHSQIGLSQTGLEDMIAWVKREESSNNGRESPVASTSFNEPCEMASNNDHETYMPLFIKSEIEAESEITIKYEEIEG